MTQVTILYMSNSDTFIADDGYGNTITFKADRINKEHAQNSTGKSLGPMISLLMACGACSGIDLVSILEKQRQSFEELKIVVAGNRESGVVPSLWQEIQISYVLKGNIDKNKAVRAADLSINKYCSVLETLRRAGAKVSYEVIIN